MATASVTHTFVAATTASAAQVNTNFDDLVTFLNNSVVHVDGSKAMSGALAMGSNKITGLATPTASTDAASKGYVDGAIPSGALASLNTVGTAQIDNGAVTEAKLGADAVTSAKLADNAVNSEHYVDGSIDDVHLSSDAKDTQYHTEGGSGNITMTSSEQTIVTQTIVPNYTGIALVVGTFDFVSSGGAGATVARGILEKDSVNQTQEAIFYSPNDANRQTVTQSWIVTVSDGVSTTLRLRVAENDSSNNPAYTCNATHTRMNIIFLRS